MSTFGDEVARARRSDPDTSHAAAESVREIRDSQRAVLAVLVARGPMTDEQLLEVYEQQRLRFGRLPRQAESGIRTRRRELVVGGYVVDSGRRVKLSTGRQAIVWAAR